MKQALFPVLILAGGVATRMRPMTEHIPKALLDVNGEPFIVHQLALLKRAGITEVVLCVGYLGEMIEQLLGDGSQLGLSIRYVWDGPVLLGTGGALIKALPFVGEHFFVLYGDSYLQCDYAAVQAAFEKQQASCLMTVFQNEGLWDSSNIEYAQGKIINYDKVHKTPSMKYIDYGLGVFSKDAFTGFPEDVPLDLATVYQRVLANHSLGAYEVKERFYEIGSFAGLKELSTYLTYQSEEQV